MAHPLIESFIKNAPGHYYNPDGYAGYQCKDLIDAYVTVLFPGVPWTKTITPGNANQVFATANPEYFTKVKNDWNKPNQLPPRGAIVCFAGDEFNDAGHIVINGYAKPSGMHVIEQDGFKQVPCQKNFWKWYQKGTGSVQGWLIPKPSKMPAVTPAPKVYVTIKSGDTLSAIARTKKTSVKKILTLNPKIKNADKVTVGQKVRVK